MGFYTVILVELPLSASRPPIFSWKGGLLGLALALLFWFVGVLAGPQEALPALALGLTCEILKDWYNLAGGGAGFLIAEADDARQVTAFLQPYMDLIRWDVHVAYALNYDQQIQELQQVVQQKG